MVVLTACATQPTQQLAIEIRNDSIDSTIVRIASAAGDEDFATSPATSIDVSADVVGDWTLYVNDSAAYDSYVITPC